MATTEFTLADLPGRYEEAILVCLARQCIFMSASEIRKDLETRTSPGSVLIGVLYSTLDRLENKGLIEVIDTPPTGKKGERGKKEFKINKNGKQLLRETRQIIDSVWDGVTLAFGGSL